MPYASASGGAAYRAPYRTNRPGCLSSGVTERGDMTGLRATSPLVVIALGARP